MPTSADLVTIAKALLKRGQKGWATTIQWAAGQIDNDALWKTTAQGQLEDLSNQVVTDDAEISTLEGQVKDLTQQVADTAAQVTRLQAANAELIQLSDNDDALIDQQTAQIATLTAQLAAATISPISLVEIGTHLYGFPSNEAAEAFIASQPGQTPTVYKATDFTWNPGSTT